MSRRPWGTTLIEVIVAVGIVTLLAAVLVPQVVDAKRAAKRMACLQNLRSIVMGLTTYADDQNARLPPGVQRFPKRVRDDLSANIFYHRDLGYDLARILRSHVSLNALNCPEPQQQRSCQEYRDFAVAYSNYLFLWGAAAGTPEEGYTRLDRAPPWGAAIADATWVGVLNLDLLGFNHSKKATHCRWGPYYFARAGQDFSENQYTSQTVKPIYSMNAGLYDGSAKTSVFSNGEGRQSGRLFASPDIEVRVYVPSVGRP